MNKIRLSIAGMIALASATLGASGVAHATPGTCHEQFNFNSPQWVAVKCDSGTGNYKETVKCTNGGGLYTYVNGQTVSVGHWSLAQCPSTKPYQVDHWYSFV